MADPLTHSLAVIEALAGVGHRYPNKPEIKSIEFMRPYLDAAGEVDVSRLDDRDGGITRREAILRYLVLCAVIDQGPDIEGVRLFSARVINDLYRREVRLFHSPLKFFQEFNIAVDEIVTAHDHVKGLRKDAWAKANGAKNAGRYLLYLDNAKQALGYAVYRWGAPLILPWLLAKDAEHAGGDTHDVLHRYLRSCAGKRRASAEVMSHVLKDHERYGLGKAIGDKAAHLFAKWCVHSYPLLASETDARWGPWSFEIPFDSNAGRVLYRTGFISDWATDTELVQWGVLQPGKGKLGGAHMRVTNLREQPSSIAGANEGVRAAHDVISIDHLGIRTKAMKHVSMQRIPSALSIVLKQLQTSARTLATPGAIDDGLIKVGTTWCFNLKAPQCVECLLRPVCAGAQHRPELITEVQT